jgi:site-specific recombinase XerD
LESIDTTTTIGKRDKLIIALMLTNGLRHTCGSLLVEQGVDVETIKDMLGHTDTQTTRIYIEMARQKRLLEQSPSNIIAGMITKPTKKKRRQK